jgi:hypothetical protein
MYKTSSTERIAMRKFTNVKCDIASFKLALRVLSAWNNHQTPAESDVAALRKAFPSFTLDAPDELACEVIENLRPHILRRTPRPEQNNGVVLVFTARAAG